MNNVQIEIALRDAQKEIKALQEEVERLKTVSSSAVSVELTVLKDALKRKFDIDRTYPDWARAFVEARDTNAAATAAQIEKDSATGR
jgi:hypothetical protein